MSGMFQHSKTNPYHISVGAVLVNKEGKILVHKALKKDHPNMDTFKQGTLDELYVLMRESLEDGELIEGGVLRGIKEEFGAEGIVKKYLGSIQAPLTIPYEWEKTTLYFEVELTAQGERSFHDMESVSELMWMEPQELIEKMKYQSTHSERGDVDESKIIEAYVKYR